MTLREIYRRSRRALSRAVWNWNRRHRKATGQIAALQAEMSLARKKHLARKPLASALRAARIEQMRGFR